MGLSQRSLSPSHLAKKADMCPHLLWRVSVWPEEWGQPYAAISTHTERWVHAGSIAQLCLTLCDLMGHSPPGSSVHGISQARILEWVAISSYRGPSWPRDQTCVSCIGRRVLYHWATWEARLKWSAWHQMTLMSKKKILGFPFFLFITFPKRDFNESISYTECLLSIQFTFTLRFFSGV